MDYISSNPSFVFFMVVIVVYNLLKLVSWLKL